MKEKYRWKIECAHTPEIIDRILMPIRKRGICLIHMDYNQKDSHTATCTLEFETEPADLERIYKNMQRIHDIREVIRL